MVRKKRDSFKTAKPFAPAGKLLMIEKNRLLNSPQKTPKSSRVSTASDITTEKAVSTKTPKADTKKRMLKPGIKAIREIKKFQSTTMMLVPKASFSRVVREIMQVTGKEDYKFSTMAMVALQEAMEMAIVNLFEVANLCCLHAKRVTLYPSDIRLTRRAFGLDLFAIPETGTFVNNKQLILNKIKFFTVLIDYAHEFAAH